MNSKLLQDTVVFTALSVVLGYAASRSPAIEQLGWLVGTLISTMGGAFYGYRGPILRAAAAGGAVVGGVSIAVGCGLAFLAGAVPLDGLVAAVMVGIATGAAAGAGLCVARRRLAQPATSAP